MLYFYMLLAAAGLCAAVAAAIVIKQRSARTCPSHSHIAGGTAWALVVVLLVAATGLAVAAVFAAKSTRDDKQRQTYELVPAQP